MVMPTLALEFQIAQCCVPPQISKTSCAEIQVFMQPIFPGHSIFFDGNVNAKGLKLIHRKLGHRCGKWFIDPRTFEGLRRSGTATNDTAFANRRDPAQILKVNSESEIDAGFETLVQRAFRRARRGCRSVLLRPARAACGAGGTPYRSGDLGVSRVRRGRRP